MGEKVVVTVALSGAVTRKGTERGMSPYVPITPDEIAEETKRCFDAGAGVVHLHARDPKTGITYLGGQGEENVNCFREMVEKIRAKCPIIINITTGGGAGQSIEEKLMPVKAIRPEMASFTAGMMCYGMFSRSQNKFLMDSKSGLNFSEMLLHADVMREHNVKPELEIYNHAMLNNIKIIEHAFVKPLHIQFVMGMPGQITPAVPKYLVFLTDTAQDMFDRFTWGVAVAGIKQWPVIAAAAAMGAQNIRTGLEDNIYIEEGVLAKSNAEMVEKAVSLAKGVGREIASPDEARKILNLI